MPNRRGVAGEGRGVAGETHASQSPGPPRVEITIGGVAADTSVRNSGKPSARIQVQLSDAAIEKIREERAEVDGPSTASCRIWWQGRFLEADLPVLLP